MADIKINNLVAYTDPVSTDVLPIVDVGNDLTKKVSIADLLENAGTGSASAPSFSFDGDNNTGIYRPGADQVALTAGGTQVLLAESTGITIPGNLTVSGTTTTVDTVNLTVKDKNIELGVVSTPTNTTADGGGITLKGATDKTINWVNSTGCWTFNQPTNFNDHVRIDSSGKLLVGTSSSIGFIGSTSATLQAINTSTRYALGMERATNDSAGAVCVFRKTRSASNGGSTVVNSGDDLGYIRFAGTDGSSAVRAAQISAHVDGTPGANDMPGRLVFSTTADGSSSPTERMRIDSSGNVGIGTSSPAAPLDLQMDSVSGIKFDVRSGGGSEITTYQGSSNSNVRAFQVNCSQFLVETGAVTGTTTSEALRIDSSGRLLVGTSSASGSYLLQVNSDATINSLTIGRGAGNISTNTAYGYQALYSNTTGTSNTTLGYQAGYALTTGSNNTIIGAIQGTAGLANTVIIGAGTTERARCDSAGIWSFLGTGSVVIPVGTEAQRPSTAAKGMLRFNDDTDEAEIYDGTSWGALGGGGLNPALIGTSPSQIPVNGYLGKQAFVDEVGTLRPYFPTGSFYSAPQDKGDIQFRYVSDTEVQLVMKGLDGTIRSSVVALETSVNTWTPTAFTIGSQSPTITSATITRLGTTAILTINFGGSQTYADGDIVSITGLPVNGDGTGVLAGRNSGAGGATVQGNLVTAGTNAYGKVSYASGNINLGRVTLTVTGV